MSSKPAEADPIPGLVLVFYVCLFYWLFVLSGCGSMTFVFGAAPRNTIRERSLPPDSQSCRVDFHPWNEPCNNP